jgi:hypothetical protein
MNNKKEVFIRNPARHIQAQSVQENYIPEYVRLMAEGKLKGLPQADELPEHQAKIRNQAIKDLQMAPKITVPSVGQQDLGWNKRASFYDEALSDQPVYDHNVVRNDLTSEELEALHDQISKERIDFANKNANKEAYQSLKEEKIYNPPSSLDQVSNNEIVVISQGKVVFSSLKEEEVKEKLAHLIFEQNINPDDVVVIKRLPISISINLG